MFLIVITMIVLILMAGCATLQVNRLIPNFKITKLIAINDFDLGENYNPQSIKYFRLYEVMGFYSEFNGLTIIKDKNGSKIDVTFYGEIRNENGEKVIGGDITRYEGYIKDLPQKTQELCIINGEWRRFIILSPMLNIGKYKMELIIKDHFTGREASKTVKYQIVAEMPKRI